jgi:hypothetical protein
MKIIPAVEDRTASSDLDKKNFIFLDVIGLSALIHALASQSSVCGRWFRISAHHNTGKRQI